MFVEGTIVQGRNTDAMFERPSPLKRTGHNELRNVRKSLEIFDLEKELRMLDKADEVKPQSPCSFNVSEKENSSSNSNRAAEEGSSLKVKRDQVSEEDKSTATTTTEERLLTTG